MEGSNMPISYDTEEEREPRKYDRGGKTYFLTASDPYNFWTIKSSVGVTPDVLSRSVYTTYDDAVLAINGYINKITNEAKRIQDKKNKKEEDAKVLRVAAREDAKLLKADIDRANNEGMTISNA